jgi:hypothetical protein
MSGDTVSPKAVHSTALKIGANAKVVGLSGIKLLQLDHYLCALQPRIQIALDGSAFPDVHALKHPAFYSRNAGQPGVPAQTRKLLDFIFVALNGLTIGNMIPLQQDASKDEQRLALIDMGEK